MNTQTLSKKHYYLFFYLLFGGLALTAQGELFFSEYVEGTSNNKCIEIFNPTDQDIVLTDVYRIVQYRNGSTTPKTLSNLTGIIPAGEPYVICDRTLGTYSDQLFTAGPNGNDAFVLQKNGTVVDLFGTIGCDPGESGWIVDGEFTKDVTLRRNACIIKGVTSSSGCNFPGAGGWTAYPVNTFSGLGNHDPGSAEVEILGNGALCENPEIKIEATEGFARYRWSTGGTTRSINVSSAGTYSVTVTTSLGCTAEATKVVNGTSPEIFATVSDIKPASCRPKKDGSFRVTPSGGSGGFSYAWETGSGSSSLITGLGAGTYNVTVTDDNGCSIANEVVVGGEVTVPLSFNATGETCKGRHDGTITLFASGSNLQYSIDGDDFDSSNRFTDLAPGDYVAQVIDNQGCGDAKNIKVEGGTRFTLSNSIVAQSKCQGEGNGGQIILEPEGGRRPYLVSFDGGPFLANNFVFSDLQGDTFDIVIRDASGCEKSFEQEIEEGSDLTITGYDLTPATCVGIDDGGISIQIDKGSGNISYSMRNDFGNWFPAFSPDAWMDLPVGQNTVLVTDNDFDCRIPIDFEITEESPLLTNIVNPTPCGDDQKATITVQPQTGIAPYQYSLDTGLFVNSNVFSDLDLGSYVVTTRDSLGCIKVDSVNFAAAESFEIQLATPSPESCANYEDGQITVFTSNTNTVEYRLEDGAYGDNPVFSGLSSGDYTVYAKSGACTDSATVTIASATPIVLVDAVPQIALCEGGDDGQLTITVSGGVQPYQYKLENTPYQANNIFTNLTQGNYTLTVRDANLCEQTFTDVTLAGPVRLDADCMVIQHVSTKDGSDGAAQVTVFGGASPYNIQLVDAGFNNITSSTGVESFTNLPAGDYTVAITDFNGCMTTCTFTINEPQCDFSITHTQSDATCFEAADGTVSLVLPSGNTPFTFNWSDAQYNGQAELTGLVAGTYSVTVTDQAGCKDSLTASIIEPPLLSVEIIANNETICEKDTAQLSVTNTYAQYNWSNETTGPTAKVYEAGTYQITVRNGAGCVATDNIVINVIAQDTMRETRFTCDASGVGTFAVEERGVDGCMDIVIRTFELARRDTTPLIRTTCNPAEAGVVTNRYNNTFGCDSLVIITTNLLRSDTTYQTEMSCNSDEVGFRNVVLTNGVGCDSTLIIETILDDVLPQSSLTAFTCNESEVGIDTAMLKTLAGCDSLLITTTNLLRSDTTYQTEMSCNSDEVGFRNVVLTNGVGCDSTLIIETILDDVLPQSSLAAFTCNESEVGIDTAMLKTLAGCDSLLITTTNLLRSDTTYQTEMSCNSDEVGFRNVVLTNRVGCDSTLIIETILDDVLPQSSLMAFTCNESEVGIDTAMLKTLAGCDSLLITTTNLLRSDTTYQTEMSCNSDEVGFRNVVLTNGVGCDSTLIIETILDDVLPQSSLMAFTCNESEVGIDTAMLKTLAGCDSLLITTTNLLRSDTIYQTEMSCNSDEVGFRQEVLTNAVGCDSTLIIETILDDVLPQSSLMAFTCNESEVGIDTAMLKTLAGCDSLLITTTNLLRSDTIYQTEMSCNSDEVGFRQEVLTNAVGCDSTLIIETILDDVLPQSSLMAFTCNESEVGIDTAMLKTLAGCDSLLITTTNLLRSDTIYQTEMSCNSDEVGFRNVVLTNGVGCDSTLIIETILDDVLPQSSLMAFTCNESEVGIDTAMLKTLAGCDSLLITTTNLLRSDTIYQTEMSCNSDEVGFRQEVLTNAVGCDSTLIIETILDDMLPQSSLTAFTCNESEVGIDTAMLKTLAGCDSLLITTTNLLRSDTTYQTEMSCNSSEIGVRREVLTNTVGCDSTLVIETVLDESVEKSLLTVFTCNPIEVGIDTVFAMTFAGCDSLIITQTISNASELTNLATTTCNIANVSIDTLFLTNQFLCDSLVVTNTTLAPSDFLSLAEQSCNPMDTGLVIQNLINQFGCDSTVEIHISLIPINDCQLGFSLLADTICWDAIQGTIQLMVTEGNPPFDYYILNDFWRDTVQKGMILTTDAETILTNIPVGQYSIVLVNDRNVRNEERIAVTQANEIIVDGLFSDYAGFAVSCEGQADGSIDLNITGGQAPYTYLWGDGTAADNLQNLAAGDYQVTVTDTNGCQQVATFDLFSTSEMQIDFQSFSPKCFGDVAGRITIYDLPNANGTVEYSLDGVLFQPIGALPFTIEDLPPNDYQLFVQDENDCQASALFSVPIPIDNQLTIGDTKSIILGDSLTLTPKANFEIDRFEWSATVPLTCENCIEIKTIPTQNGAYTLTAYDANGCKTTASTTVNLRKESQVYLPNAFSPNDDGNNDVYQILTGNVVKRLKSLKIFDYEGRLMYQVTNRPPNDAAVGWDGMFNGQKMLPAVFVVFVEVELLDGTDEMYRQTMTLVK